MVEEEWPRWPHEGERVDAERDSGMVACLLACTQVPDDSIHGPAAFALRSAEEIGGYGGVLLGILRASDEDVEDALGMLPAPDGRKQWPPRVPGATIRCLCAISLETFVRRRFRAHGGVDGEEHAAVCDGLLDVALSLPGPSQMRGYVVRACARAFRVVPLSDREAAWERVLCASVEKGGTAGVELLHACFEEFSSARTPPGPQQLGLLARGLISDLEMLGEDGGKLEWSVLEQCVKAVWRGGEGGEEVVGCVQRALHFLSQLEHVEGGRKGRMVGAAAEEWKRRADGEAGVDVEEEEEEKAVEEWESVVGSVVGVVGVGGKVLQRCECEGVEECLEAAMLFWRFPGAWELLQEFGGRKGGKSVEFCEIVIKACGVGEARVAGFAMTGVWKGVTVLDDSVREKAEQVVFDVVDGEDGDGGGCVVLDEVIQAALNGDDVEAMSGALHVAGLVAYALQSRWGIDGAENVLGDVVLPAVAKACREGSEEAAAIAFEGLYWARCWRASLSSDAKHALWEALGDAWSAEYGSLVAAGIANTVCDLLLEDGDALPRGIIVPLVQSGIAVLPRCESSTRLEVLLAVETILKQLDFKTTDGGGSGEGGVEEDVVELCRWVQVQMAEVVEQAEEWEDGDEDEAAVLCARALSTATTTLHPPLYSPLIPYLAAFLDHPAIWPDALRFASAALACAGRGEERDEEAAEALGDLKFFDALVTLVRRDADAIMPAADVAHRFIALGGVESLLGSRGEKIGEIAGLAAGVNSHAASQLCLAVVALAPSDISPFHEHEWNDIFAAAEPMHRADSTPIARSQAADWALVAIRSILRPLLATIDDLSATKVEQVFPASLDDVRIQVAKTLLDEVDQEASPTYLLQDTALVGLLLVAMGALKDEAPLTNRAFRLAAAMASAPEREREEEERDMERLLARAHDDAAARVALTFLTEASHIHHDSSPHHQPTPSHSLHALQEFLFPPHLPWSALANIAINLATTHSSREFVHQVLDSLPHETRRVLELMEE